MKSLLCLFLLFLVGCVNSPYVQTTVHKNVTHEVVFYAEANDAKVDQKTDYDQWSETGIDLEQLIQDAIKDIVPTLEISP